LSSVIPMVWEIVYITTFRILVKSSSSCAMLLKHVLFIAVLNLVKYLKRDVGSSLAPVTYMAESRKLFTFQGYGGAFCFFRLAIFWKGFATREVGDCQELSFRAF